MKTTCRRRPSGVTHLRVTGRLRGGDIARLRLRILSVMEGAGDTLVDLRGLDRWDVDVIQILCAARRTAGARGSCLEVLCDESAVHITRLAGLEQVAGV